MKENKTKSERLNMNITGCNSVEILYGLRLKYNDPILALIFDFCKLYRLHISSTAKKTASRLKNTIVIKASIFLPLVSVSTVAAAIYIFRSLCITNLINALKNILSSILLMTCLTFLYFLKKYKRRLKTMTRIRRKAAKSNIMPLLSNILVEPKREAEGSSIETSRISLSLFSSLSSLSILLL